MCIYLVSKSCYSLVTTHHVWLLSFSTFFCVDHRALSVKCDKEFLFRAEHSQVSHSLHAVQLWFLCTI